MKIPKEKASEEVSRLLVGSDLDEIKISGRSISLRFISDRLVDGCLKFIYIDFCCGSRIIELGDKWICGEFAEERSLFLSRIFFLYGESVNLVKLSEDGSLILRFDKSDLHIFLTKDDLGYDDAVWNVGSEVSDNPSQETLYSVSCVPIEGQVAFFSGETRPDA